jgi:pilus assembly protein CpaE
MLTVLIGTTDKELEGWVRALAGRLVTVASIDKLSAALGVSQPAVVLLDLRDRPGTPAALALVRRSYPSAGIIVLVDRLDPHVMLEAMRAGANEFLAAPVTADDLKGAFERVASLANPAPEQGKILAFLGAKGGVGTTTLAVNVATALSQIPTNRVLMIDLHLPFGDAALFFGAEARFSVLDALQNAHRLDDAYFKSLVVQTAAGPYLLASSDRSGAVDAQRVRGLLAFVAGRYSHIVVDIPRSDAAIWDALEPLSALVIVANQELSTVRTAGRMASSLRLKYGTERVQVVVSRHDPKSEIGQTDIERATGGRVHFLFPNNYRLAVDAVNKGRPFVTDNHTKLASSIGEFAKSLAGVPKEPARAASKSQGLLSRLTGRR